MRSRWISISVSILALMAAIATTSTAQTKRTFNIGYFEAGPYAVHSILRNELYSQLRQIIPEEYDFATVPFGFRSAGWKRDTCRMMAEQLVYEKSVDIIIAVGPWVVNDLLEAGYERPIIAMHQFDPDAEGLLDARGRPIADNLTVHHRPNKLAKDFTFLSRLLDVKRLGFLYFPSADEADEVLHKAQLIGERLGFEVVTAEGYDNYGTYAYFKSFKALPSDIDAVYLAPLWGIQTDNLGHFLTMLGDNRKPGITSEGKVVLEKGAFATCSMYSLVSEAKFSADKIVEIMRGATPADLPVTFESGLALAVNNATAQKCGVDLSEEVLSDFYVIEAPISNQAGYYTLNDAINRAMNQNPGYQAQVEALEAAAKAVGQAYSDYLPHLYSTTRVAHVDDNFTRNLRGLVSNDVYETSLNLEQHIFSLETIRGIQLGSRRRDLESVNLIQAQLDLEFAVSLAYLNYLRCRETLGVLRANRALIEHNLELALSNVQLGAGDSLDIIRLEDERYQGTVRVADAKADLRVAAVTLNALFNMPGNEVFALDTLSFSSDYFYAGEQDLYSQLTGQSTRQGIENKLMAQALTVNPATREIDTRIDIQKARLAGNSARFYPSVGLKASLSFSDWLEETPSFEEENTTWSIAGVFNLPIFLGSDRFRERARLKAELSELEYRRDDINLSIMRRIQTSLHRLVGTASKITSSAQSVKRARQLLDVVVPAYGAGTKSLIDLLDAHSNSVESELAAINTRYNYYQTMAELVHAAGWAVHDDYSSFVEKFHQQLED